MSIADLSDPPSLTTLCYPTAAKNTPKSPSCPIRLARSGTQLLVLWDMASCGESTTLKASLPLRMSSALRSVNQVESLLRALVLTSMLSTARSSTLLWKQVATSGTLPTSIPVLRKPSENGMHLRLHTNMVFTKRPQAGEDGQAQGDLLGDQVWLRNAPCACEGWREAPGR